MDIVKLFQYNPCMSQITDLLSRVKQAEQKKGVPPGLAAAMDSPARRKPGKRRAVLLGSSVVLAVALGVFTLYVAGSLEKRAPGAAPEAVQLVAAPPASVQKSQPVSPLPEKRAAAVKLAEKGGQVKAVSNSSSAVKEEMTAGAQPEGAGPVDPGPQKAVDDGSLTHERAASAADRAAHELYLAGNYERAGDDAGAIASYAKAIELDPGNYRAMNNIASILLKAGSTAEAVPYLKDALAARPDYVPALVNMGIARAGQGGAQEAEVWFGKALSIEPSSVPALLNMAVLYERSGKKELAGEYYGKLKSLGHPEGAAGLKRLR